MRFSSGCLCVHFLAIVCVDVHCRMVQRRNDNGSHGNKMVAIDFKQTAMQEKTGDVLIPGCYVLVHAVHLPYLILLFDYPGEISLFL